MNEYLAVENRAGQAIRFGDTRVVLIEKSLRFQPPGMWGLFFWRRPTAVVVETPQTGRQVIKIQDVTRIAQVNILGAGLLITLLAWLLFRKK